ncbi:MAG: tetratricopeptide repeat protein [Chromatiales bacterium]|nr:tetratricopeptide repeat protein [Chromatiales bacterium]
MNARLATLVVVLSLLWMLNAAAEPKAMSPKTYAAIQAAQALMDANLPGQAVEALQGQAASLAEQPYDLAMVLQIQAHAELARDDPNTAAELLERCLNLNTLADKERLALLYTLAQVSMLAQRYDSAARHMSRWLAETPTPKAEAHALLGSAHLQAKRYAQAIEPLRRAIELSDSPLESWYQALLGAYFETKRLDRCTALLRDMIRRFPQRDGYWRQLGQVELARRRYREALVAMDLAYLRGALNAEQDLLTLAQLRLQQGTPYPAAELLEKEIGRGRIHASASRWELTANAWYQAKETTKSMEALRRASKIKGATGSLRIRLAQLYLEARQWDTAQASLDELLSKTTLDDDDRGQAWLLLGIARHGAQSPQEARAAFTQAAKLASSRDQARQWLGYLDNTD